MRTTTVLLPFRSLLLTLFLVAGTLEVSAATAMRFATLAPSSSKCPLESSSSTAFAKGISEHFSTPPAIQPFCYRDSADLPRAVDEVVASKPPLVVVWASVTAVRLLKEKDSLLPIVFVNISDPVESGLVQSLARPGGSVTGISNSNEDVLAKRVELLRQALPGARRLAILCNLDNAQQAGYVRITEKAAQTFSFDSRVYSVTSSSEMSRAFAEMQRDAIDAVVVVPNVFFFLNRQDLVAEGRRTRLPVMYFTSTFEELGGLFIYSANLDDLSHRSTALVSKILRGAKPADIPVEQPIKFDFVINAKTAREIGMVVGPMVLMRATRVVE